MKRIGMIAAAAMIALGAGTVSASADSCSGHSHDTGTAVGAVGGGLIGGLATHSVVGGLGGAVAECLVQNFPTPIEFVGVRDQFGQSGTPDELIEHYGLGVSGIVSSVRKVLNRKQT